MIETAQYINTLIRDRRSIFPKTYIDKPIDPEIIDQVLENANWAPTHKFTEPWRFRVITDQGLDRFADTMARWYKANYTGDQFSERKYKKVQSNPKRSGAVIAIVMQRDPEERIPEFEEIAAVACAVQNMYLTCHAYGIGSYWSTPKAIGSTEVASFLDLQKGESCLGFFYMGHHEMPQLEGKRGPIAEKTRWIKD
ncbi:MAG: nitroreductase [Bacteroidota bacterium]